MTDEEKNKFDALSIFWKQALDAISERRKYEWKMMFWVWVALATLATALLLKPLELKLPAEYRWPTLGILGIALCFICTAHAIFLKGVGDHHTIDRKLARATLESIRSIQSLCVLDAYVKILDDNPATTCPLDWSRSIQFAVTVFLALVDLMFLFVRFYAA